METTKAIQALQEAFSEDQVVLPASDEFKRLNGSYLSALESDITPACIFRPRSAEDVSKFLKAVVPLNVIFAIRGAGQQPLPGCANNEGGITIDLELQGGNSLGLSPEDGPLVSLLLLSYWGDKSDDSAVLGVMEKALEAIKNEAKKRGQSVPFEFLNYAWSSGVQDPIGSYGPENKKKLQDASKAYDPEGVFQKLVPGAFKLFA